MLSRKGFVCHHEQPLKCLFSTFCVDFLRCTDFFYYIILYVVWEVVTGKMRNLQKSLEKVTICTGKSFEKVAISTKTRLKIMRNLPKVPWKNRMGAKIGWKITCPFCLCFIVFCFYENNRLIKKLFLPCAGWPLQINLLQFNKSFRRQSAVRDIGRPRSATKIQRKMLTWVKQT